MAYPTSKNDKLHLEVFLRYPKAALNNIMHIKTHIHRITFTTKYPYDVLKVIFPNKFRLKEITKESRSINSIYKLEGKTTAYGFNCHIMTGFRNHTLYDKINRITAISIVPMAVDP